MRTCASQSGGLPRGGQDARASLAPLIRGEVGDHPPQGLMDVPGQIGIGEIHPTPGRRGDVVCHVASIAIIPRRPRALPLRRGASPSPPAAHRRGPPAPAGPSDRSLRSHFEAVGEDGSTSAIPRDLRRARHAHNTAGPLQSIAIRSGLGSGRPECGGHPRFRCSSKRVAMAARYRSSGTSVGAPTLRPALAALRVGSDAR